MEDLPKDRKIVGLPSNNHRKVAMLRSTLGIILCMLSLTSGTALAQERYALIIGNGAYEFIDPLKNPPNDARLISEAMESVGFNVTTLINVDVEAMQDALNKFATDLDGAGENAVGVFYYAGHGVSYQGKNWLIPVGANIQQATHLKYRTVSADEVLELMEAAQNATDILILDACRNSPFRSFSLTGTRAVSQGMSRMDVAPMGSYIAFSTAPGQVAYDGTGEVSPFAEAFASEITTSNQPIGEMMIDVRVKVRDKTALLGPQPQIPWSNSSLMGKFWFNPGAVQTASAAQNSGSLANIEIIVDTTPHGATIYIDDIPEGTSPLRTPVTGNKTLEIRATRPGFMPATRTIMPNQMGERIKLSLSPRQTAGSQFSDGMKLGGDGPQMIVIPGDTFSPKNLEIDAIRREEEFYNPMWIFDDQEDSILSETMRLPDVTVTMPAFAISSSEITRDEFNRFAKESGYVTMAETVRITDLGFGDEGCGGAFDDNVEFTWRAPGIPQTDEHPVTCLTIRDAQAYADWLSEQTGQQYRLPTTAEFSIASRANWLSAMDDNICGFGNVADQFLLRIDDPEFLPELMNGDRVLECDDGYVLSAPVSSFAPGALGVTGLYGNMTEIVVDGWSYVYGREFLIDKERKAHFGWVRSLFTVNDKQVMSTEYCDDGACYIDDPVPISHLGPDETQLDEPWDGQPLSDEQSIRDIPISNWTCGGYWMGGFLTAGEISCTERGTHNGNIVGMRLVRGL
jgi:formylglycine-generating enzyme required for sulfatase activity